MMTRADWVLVAIALCTLPLLYLHFWNHQDTATMLRIQTASAAATITTLTPDRHVQIAGPIGESTIEIRAGRARFLRSPCAGKVCLHSGWLRETGQLAACLPNRISIQLLGNQPRFDAINF
jgi:hypothetical protein